MSLWIFAAAMALIAAFFVVLPLWRRGGTQVDHREGALAIFVDQLKEVEAERQRGLISEAEAEAAGVEIKRRMLAVEKQGARRAGRTGGGWALMGSAVLVPALAMGIYASIGAPQMQSLPFAAREEERGEDQRIADLTEQLLARLLSDENGGPTEGWALLGQTYMRMGRYDDAVRAFSMVENRDDVNAGILTQLAEALIAADDGRVTVRANAVLDRALKMDPLNPAGSYYKAQWLEQDGRPEKARDLLILRLQQEEREQPWSQTFVDQINRLGADLGKDPVTMADFVTAAPGPSAEDVEAAGDMSDEERSAFIQSMVDRLAARLAEEPNDLDGWLQLGRAYLVLGDQDKARAAYEAADALLVDVAEDDPRRAIVAQGLAATAG